eukprot:1326089-Prymnesium_polylepis.1
MWRCRSSSQWCTMRYSPSYRSPARGACVERSDSSRATRTGWPPPLELSSHRAFATFAEAATNSNSSPLSARQLRAASTREYAPAPSLPATASVVDGCTPDSPSAS